MPVNDSGQGNSANTPLKQKAFRYFMHVHAGIVWRAQKWPVHKHYYYIDTNAGTGKNDDATDGSTIIARDVLAEHRLIMHGHAIDNNDQALKYLQNNLGLCSGIQLLHGNNAQILQPALLPAQKWVFGVVYCDPNGVDDLPLETLIKFFDARILNTQVMDILIHLSANALKRCRGAGLHKYTLQGIMEQINKNYWYIRESYHRDQWTFLFGTNYNKWPPLKLRVDGIPLPNIGTLGMFPCSSPKGQEILDKLLLTTEERKKKQ